MSYRVPIIFGDGAGPELVRAAQSVLAATGVEIEWEEVPAGERAIESHGNPLPPETLDRVRERGILFKGPLTGRLPALFRSPTMSLRQSLDLYVRVRPYRLFPGVPSRFNNVDLAVIGEMTEDLAGGAQFPAGSQESETVLDLVRRLSGKDMPAGAAVGVRITSPQATRRAAEFAFRYAEQHGRRKVTVGHKASRANHPDATFLAAASEVARSHAVIEFEEMSVDTLCHQLVRRPEQFDVLLLSGSHSDFVSDICAALIGGLGLTPGANVGATATMFEAAHGTAPKYAGKNTANPVALILSGALLLRHLDEHAAAQRVERAVARVLLDGKVLSQGLAAARGVSAATTSEVAEAIAAEASSERNT